MKPSMEIGGSLQTRVRRPHAFLHDPFEAAVLHVYTLAIGRTVQVCLIIHLSYPVCATSHLRMRRQHPKIIASLRRLTPFVTLCAVL